MIRELITDDEVRRSFEVMRELRTHLPGPDQYVRQEEDGVVKAAAGFRIVEMLFQGRHLYVDDLVTAEAERAKGHASALIDWMAELATREGCATLELSSSIQACSASAPTRSTSRRE
jgi:hypothetical protein